MQVPALDLCAAAFTERNIADIRANMKRLGWVIDWDRETSAHEVEYYRWTQWLFLRFFEAGLAYQKESPVNWCPKDQTVVANEYVVDGLCERCGTPVELRNLQTVWDAGIPVAMGTDAGNIGTLHGPSVFRELGLMVQAGLTPLQALRAATVNGAKAMGMERDLGTLAQGKLADVVILDADPLADVQNLSRIHRVIKDGQLFAPAELMRSLNGS